MLKPSPLLSTAMWLVLPSIITLSTASHAEEPFFLGHVDIKTANIQYSNPNTGVSLTRAQTQYLVKKLVGTRAINQVEINQQLKLIDTDTRGDGFLVANPYYPQTAPSDHSLPKIRSAVINGVSVENPEGYSDPHEGYTVIDGDIKFFQQPEVTQWYSDISHNGRRAQEICAVKFKPGSQTDYRMKTFASKDEALIAGWTITHQYQCGTCSTLQDLAVYIGIPNQTKPISACTSQARGDYGKLKSVKQCIIDAVGFTPMCAESWAYNGIHTGAECGKTCFAAKGNPLVIDEKTGQLNSCLWCDEKTSGPGFKYSAGRTRRGSGLESAILRPNDKLFYEADHSKYF
jgi:hypothetical protein